MSTETFPRADKFFSAMWAAALGGDRGAVDVSFTGAKALRSPFAVTDFGAASVAAASAAAAELDGASGGRVGAVSVDRILTSSWFRNYTSRPVHPQPSRTPWVAISKEYETKDGRWLRLQANYDHPKAAILGALGVGDDADEIEAVVRAHEADVIEQQIVDNGGTVAASRSLAEWDAHPQGRAVAQEKLVDITVGSSAPLAWEPTPTRPLAGVRVLDMTRVLAGPTGTRFLASLGAEVMRLEAPDGDELGAGGDQMLGKRWAILDLKSPSGRDRFLELLSTADVFVHGYRPGALDGLGLGTDVREANRPGLVEVTLDAYGWTGPWAGRRGFDTLVQFSVGMANETTTWALEDPDNRIPINALGDEVDASRPRLLPVQILDHATGYLMAASVMRGLTRRITDGTGSRARLSLARTAAELIDEGRVPAESPIQLPLDGPFEDRIYMGSRGPVRRFVFPASIEGTPMYWERPADMAGASNPEWVTVR